MVKYYILFGHVKIIPERIHFLPTCIVSNVSVGYNFTIGTREPKDMFGSESFIDSAMDIHKVEICPSLSVPIKKFTLYPSTHPHPRISILYAIKNQFIWK